MELRREFFLSFGMLVLFNLLLAFGAIGLLWRMSPAIEEILKENARSIDAAEDMLAVLVRAAGQPVSGQEREAFDDALRRARGNITEEEETPTLDRLESRLDVALSGDGDARRDVLGEILGLIRINRTAMQVEDERAQRLGAAGAWAAVFTALVAFGLTFLILVRLERRVLEPILELDSVLSDRERGDRQRRCRTHRSPAELRHVLDGVNSLLDRLSDRRARDDEAESAAASAARSALVHLLEEGELPTVVLDSRGSIVAASESALGQLSSESGPALRERLKRVPLDSSSANGEGKEGEKDDGIQATELRDGSWICTLSAEGR